MELASINWVLTQTLQCLQKLWPLTKILLGFLTTKKNLWPRPFESILKGKTRNCPSVRQIGKGGWIWWILEFLKNPRRQTKKWIVSFFNDILSILKLPKIFKRANKPGIYGIQPVITYTIAARDLQAPRVHDFTEDQTHDRGTNTS
jgi:hypothetical protein